ncbi:MAG: hypothetical protein Q7T56_03795 [Nocardioidaceae bacterium]|nr:hypothetical protein [Nocardioidaceae bacterium]
MTAAVAAVVLLVAALAIGVTQLSGDEESSTSRETTATADPAPDPGADTGPMSSAAADELRSRLGDDGWTCYDSLDEPVVVKRCFVVQPGDAENAAPTRGELTLQYEDDAVGALRFRVTGAQGSAGTTALVEQTATSVGDLVLGGEGAALAAVAVAEPDGTSTDVGGVDATGNGAGVDLYVDGWGFPEVGSPPLPGTEDVQAALAADGFVCGTESTVFTCEGRQGDVRLRLSGSAGDAGTPPGAWSVTVGPVEYTSSLDEAMGVAADVLATAGIVDSEGAEFLRANPPDGSAGDFAGHGVSVISSDLGEVYNAIISVDPIR